MAIDIVQLVMVTYNFIAVDDVLYEKWEHEGYDTTVKLCNFETSTNIIVETDFENPA